MMIDNFFVFLLLFSSELRFFRRYFHSIFFFAVSVDGKFANQVGGEGLYFIFWLILCYYVMLKTFIILVYMLMFMLDVGEGSSDGFFSSIDVLKLDFFWRFSSWYRLVSVILYFFLSQWAKFINICVYFLKYFVTYFNDTTWDFEFELISLLEIHQYCLFMSKSMACGPKTCFKEGIFLGSVHQRGLQFKSFCIF
jgi:hypothetical protein